MAVVSRGRGAGMAMSFDGGGGEVFIADIRRFVDRAGDLRPALDPYVHSNVMNAMDEMFRTEGAKGTRSGKFDELSEKYRDWKEHRYRGERGPYYPRILSLSGRLHGSLAGRKSGHVWAMRPREFVFGTRVRTPRGADYPRFLAEGTRTMPARPFLSWDVSGRWRALWIAAIVKPVQRYLRVGLTSLERHGYIDVADFEMEASRATLAGQAGD